MNVPHTLIPHRGLANYREPYNYMLRTILPFFEPLLISSIALLQFRP